jgi:hypothetical protein
MPYNRSHVRAFLNAAEISLFASSVGAGLKALGAAELQRRLVRARTLRDKYRDLLRRQKLKTRERTGSKRGSTGNANERTAKKAAAFDQALKRFEAQAKALRAAPAAAPKARAKKSPAKPRGEAAAVVLRRALEAKNAALAARAETAGQALSSKAPAQLRNAGPGGAGIAATPPDVRAAVVESRQAAANLKPIQGHISSQVRLDQAKRDQRG